MRYNASVDNFQSDFFLLSKRQKFELELSILMRRINLYPRIV